LIIYLDYSTAKNFRKGKAAGFGGGYEKFTDWTNLGDVAGEFVGAGMARPGNSPRHFVPPPSWREAWCGASLGDGTKESVGTGVPDGPAGAPTITCLKREALGAEGYCQLSIVD